MSRSPTAEARERHFDRYTRQLELGGVTPTDIFVCPLCRNGFTRDALVGLNPDLSLAHIVPDALGGTECTLTCTACNNGNGARVEADLANRFLYEDWGNGVGEWPARLSGSFGDVGIKFSRTADASRWTLEVVHGQTNPTSLAGLEEWLRARREGKAADTQWNVRWKLRSRRSAVDAAVYQSVYLLMFAYFGYDFAFRDQYERLREQVLRPESGSWPGRICVLPTDPWAGRLGKRPWSVLFVRDPEPCVAVMLRFCPKGGRDRVFCVLLPSPDADGDCPVPQVERGAVTGSVIPFHSTILTQDSHYFEKLWRCWVGGSFTAGEGVP